MLIFIGVTSHSLIIRRLRSFAVPFGRGNQARLQVEVVDFILYFVRFLNLFWISLLAEYTDSMCPAPAQFLCQSSGDCTWSIALQVHAILVGNVAYWSFNIMGS